jgi:hypothetical protein
MTSLLARSLVRRCCRSCQHCHARTHATCSRLGQDLFREDQWPPRGNRLELAELLRRLGDGDVLMVTQLDRLARSTRNLPNILDTVAKAGAGVKSLTGRLGGHHDCGPAEHPRDADPPRQWALRPPTGVTAFAFAKLMLPRRPLVADSVGLVVFRYYHLYLQYFVAI